MSSKCPQKILKRSSGPQTILEMSSKEVIKRSSKGPQKDLRSSNDTQRSSKGPQKVPKWSSKGPQEVLKRVECFMMFWMTLTHHFGCEYIHLYCQNDMVPPETIPLSNFIFLSNSRLHSS